MLSDLVSHNIVPGGVCEMKSRGSINLTSSDLNCTSVMDETRLSKGLFQTQDSAVEECSDQDGI